MRQMFPLTKLNLFCLEKHSYAMRGTCAACCFTCTLHI